MEQGSFLVLHPLHRLFYKEFNLLSDVKYLNTIFKNFSLLIFIDI